MKPKRVILLLFLGVLGYVYIFYTNPRKPLDTSICIDKIIVTKHARKLDLISNNQIVRSYKISIGRVTKGAKEYEGDKKTPEGTYIIHDKNPNSGYYKNLGISYPNNYDIEHAKTIGKKPGGLIKIHGLKNGFGWIGRFHLMFDWTLGCIALSNNEIDEIYKTVKIGTPIEIKP